MITINIDKAKDITHDKRREARDVLMAPLDLKVTIPMYAEQAEIERQIIRESNALVQIQIDAANTVEELKLLLESQQQLIDN